MKKVLALILALSMALALAACGGGGETQETGNAGNTNTGTAENTNTATGDNIIKIGVFEPLTGDSASGGNKEYLGMQYANSVTPTVEVGGVEYTVQLVPSDNGSDTSKAITAGVNRALAIVANLDTEGEVQYVDSDV